MQWVGWVGGGATGSRVRGSVSISTYPFPGFFFVMDHGCLEMSGDVLPKNPNGKLEVNPPLDGPGLPCYDR